MWINPCAQVIFDSDPAPKDMAGPAGVDMMSQAMIRCVGPIYISTTGVGQCPAVKMLMFFLLHYCAEE